MKLRQIPLGEVNYNQDSVSGWPALATRGSSCQARRRRKPTPINFVNSGGRPQRDARTRYWQHVLDFLAGLNTVFETEICGERKWLLRALLPNS